MMRRTTITLPEDMVKELEKEAAKRMTSLSQVIREKLASERNQK